MKPDQRLPLVIICVVILAGIPGCGGDLTPPTKVSPLSKWIGKSVTVQFRRDALGTSADLPVGPDTSAINGAKTSLSGKLLDAHADCVLIERSENVHWIPRENILHIQVQS